METSKNDERRPLLTGNQARYTDVPPAPSADGVSRPSDGDGGMSRRNTFNLLVANLLLGLVQLSGSLLKLNLTPYIYSRISDQLYGPDFSSPTRHPCANTTGAAQKKADHVQSLTTTKIMELDLAMHGPSLLTISLLGAYSDYLGRRFLFFASLIGYFLRSGVTTVVAYFNLNLNWLFLGYVLNACCGGTWTILLAISSYIADNTPASSTRTLGLALAGAAAYLFGVAANFGGSYFIKITGYVYPFITVSGILLLTIAITFVLLNETTPPAERSRWPTPVQAFKSTFGFYFSKSALVSEGDSGPGPLTWRCRNAEGGLRASGGCAVNGGDCHRNLADVTVYERQGAGPITEVMTSDGNSSPLIPPASVDRRPEFILGILAFFFAVLPALSLGSIDQLYLMNQPFCWEINKFGVYTAVREVAQYSMGLLTIKILASLINEGWLGVLGFVSAAGGYLIMALANRDWMMYLAPAVSIFAPISITVTRSLMSQRAPLGKQGALFASIGFLETVCNAVGSFIFSYVYSKTVSSTFRGATFLLTVCVLILGTAIMGSYMAAIRRSDRQRQKITLVIQRPEVGT